MTRPTYAALVAEAVAASPLPARFDSLDAASKRNLTRRAEAQGVTPEAFYEALKTSTEAATVDDDLARQIVLSSGNR